MKHTLTRTCADSGAVDTCLARRSNSPVKLLLVLFTTTCLLVAQNVQPVTAPSPARTSTTETNAATNAPTATPAVKAVKPQHSHKTRTVLIIVGVAAVGAAAGIILTHYKTGTPYTRQTCIAVNPGNTGVCN
jgi:hypothetical protein